MAADQFDLLSGAQTTPPGAARVTIVSSHVRRLAARPAPEQAIPAGPVAPVPTEAMARARWLVAQLEAWRKAEHAATQARSEGASCRREAAIADLQGTGAAWHAKAEAAYQRAAAHTATADRIVAALAAAMR
jgi:hypothetical protein